VEARPNMESNGIEEVKVGRNTIIVGSGDE
jgi:hypothetical protein